MKFNIEWYKMLIASLEPFTDKEYQERVWLRGEGKEVQTYIEATCQLFDDTALSDYLEMTDKIIISKECDRILNELSNLFDTIDDKVNTIDIVNHQNMGKIRILSRDAIRMIEERIKEIETS